MKRKQKKLVLIGLLAMLPMLIGANGFGAYNVDGALSLKLEKPKLIYQSNTYLSGVNMDFSMTSSFQDIDIEPSKITPFV